MAGLAYDDRGSGAPIVLLHGIGESKETWAPVVARLVDRFRCVAIDLPGHGASPDDALGALEQVDAIGSVVDDLGLGAPLFVGHSAGGLASTLYAAVRGARGVLNVDQALDLHEFEAMLPPEPQRLRDDRFDAAWAEFETQLGAQLVPEEYRDLARLRPRQEVVLALWGDVLDHGAAAIQPVLDGALAAVACPYLAIYGETPSDGVRAALERISGAQLEVWEDHGHFLHLVDLDRFVARVVEFEGTLE